MLYPRHIAIIMDGNGRWARARGLPRIAGHKIGMEALHRIVHHASQMGLEWLTVFAFSSENWSRPESEVNHLMGLLKLFIKRDLLDLRDNNVRVRVIGNREGVPAEIERLLDEAETITQKNDGLNLVVAFNYGGRAEIVRSVKKIANSLKNGNINIDEIDEAVFSKYLDTAEMPDPDLVIRTSGEQRLSNFLLWQSAYSEFYFAPCYWPDFDERQLDRAVEDYWLRERRFGRIPDYKKEKEKLL